MSSILIKAISRGLLGHPDASNTHQVIGQSDQGTPLATQYTSVEQISFGKCVSEGEGCHYDVDNVGLGCGSVGNARSDT